MFLILHYYRWFNLLCFSVLLFSPETDREEHRETEVYEEAGDLQMHEMHQELSIGNVLTKTSEIGVWRRTEARMSDMWQEIHV